LGFREVRKWNAIDKDDYTLKSFSIKKIGAILGLFIVGIVGLYRYFY